MGFGLSGSPIGIQMQGADPTLVWVDGLTGPQAVDYHLSAYQKVSNILSRVWLIRYTNVQLILFIKNIMLRKIVFNRS